MANGAELTGGWIKLYRSLLANGHLQMPEIAFKLWIFLLLQVNHAPNQAAQCAAGEGWVTYRMIKENCCDPRESLWADSTISRALKFLEKGGYIQRVKAKNGLAQRIRIVNWHKYQSDTTSIAQEVSLEVPLEVPLGVALEVSLDKQEGEEGKEGREERSTSSAASHRGRGGSRKPSASTDKEPDPFNVAAKPLVEKLDAWLKEQELPGVPNWGAAIKITANALKGSGGKTPITPADADAALTWGLEDPFWRRRLKSACMVVLRDVWAAWTERGTGPGRPANRYTDPAANGPKFAADGPWAKRLTGS